MTSRAALLGAALALACTAIAAPVRADDEIALSLDGRHWSSDIDRPLFDPTFRWVPGDRRTRSFFVRNQGPTGARMTLEVRSRDTGHLLPDDDVDLRARAGGGAWVELENGRATDALVRGRLGEGDRLRVDVRVDFDPASTNQSELRRLPLTFTVRLEQAGLGHGDEGGGDGDGVLGSLPDTGNGVQAWMVWLGAGLVGAGLWFVVAARRRGEEQDG